MGEGAAAGAWAGTCDGAGAGAGAGLGGGGAARCIGAEARGGEAARPLRGILALVLKQESRTLELTETDHYSNGIQHNLKKTKTLILQRLTHRRVYVLALAGSRFRLFGSL